MKRKFILVIVIILILGAARYAYTQKKSAKVNESTAQPTPVAQEEIVQEPIIEEPTYERINVQPIIDTWGKKQSGAYSIVVYDLENSEIIGSKNPNDIYFAASIYKLYVAYEGYLAAANNVYDLDEIYLSDWTREKCLDEMIRTSHSPCAEKLWTELGKEDTTEKLKTYGITNTSMSAINTTAADAAILLQRLHERKDLPENLTTKMLSSMEAQIYRDALARGFSEGTFYNKVGFRELDEYHDVGILALPNGRNYAVSMLTSNVGTRAMTDLATQLEQVLNKPE